MHSPCAAAVVARVRGLQEVNRVARSHRYTLLPAEDGASVQPSDPVAKLQRTGSSGSGGRGQLPALGRQRPPPGLRSSLREALSDIRHVMGIATFRIIVLQVSGFLPGLSDLLSTSIAHRGCTCLQRGGSGWWFCVLQGVVGSLPWQAMVFFTMWLQLLGFSDLAASSLMAIFALGTSFGHVLGGNIGEEIVTHVPHHT